MLVSDELEVAYTQWMSARETYVSSHQSFLEMARASHLLTSTSKSAVETIKRYLERVQSEFTTLDQRIEALRDTGFDFSNGNILRRMGAGTSSFEMFQLRSAMGTLNVFLDNTESGTITHFLDTYAETVNQLQQRRFVMILGAAAALIFLSSLFVNLLARSLYNKINRLRGKLSELAEGNFDVPLDTNGKDEIAEISQYVQQYVDSVAEVIRNVQQSIRESERLKDTLTSTSEESASSVEEMTANIDSIGNQISSLNGRLNETGDSVSDIFNRVSELTRQIEDQSAAASQSSNAVEEMAASIENVATITTQKTEASNQLVEVTKAGSEKVSASNEVVQQIAKLVEDIMEIIGIINKIAGQTSILSMNAAIEAAHAGEYGHGFSVVAEEIRSLSNSTNENAKRIREQLQEIFQGALRAQELSEESATFFSQVQDEVNKFTDSLNEISATTDELASGTQEMSKATTDLSNATQRIREAGEGIESQTKSIDAAMNDIRNYSQEVEQGMREITSGTKEITSGMSDLNEISRRNSEQIAELSQSIKRFRLPDLVDPQRKSSEQAGPDSKRLDHDGSAALGSGELDSN